MSPSVQTQYADAIKALSSNPHDTHLKYDLVLALARSGSTEFALSEYKRLGLDAVRHNEDVMALQGRIYKDLFLYGRENQPQSAAEKAAEKYEQAYADTQGFFSGINSATMSLLAGQSKKIIEQKAKRVLSQLPDPSDTDPETLYFIEATRAECYLLLEGEDKAEKSLEAAIRHDPLNYVAHASTLKQFRMIARHRKLSYEWLARFSPPKAFHFAGHLFGVDSECPSNLPSISPKQEQALKEQITDRIQSEDLGFGYGALSAGADILIAECLLDEGGELHISLPSQKEAFLKRSILPYGQSWMSRFETCLERAASITIIAGSKTSNAVQQDSFCSLSSMGAAIRKAQSLSVPSSQLLVWDSKMSDRGTSADAQTWQKTGRAQHIIEYKYARPELISNALETGVHRYTFLSSGGGEISSRHENVMDAIRAAFDCFSTQGSNAKLGLSLELSSPDRASSNLARKIAERALPGCLCVSEPLANELALHHDDLFQTSIMGMIDNELPVYALQKRRT